MGKEIPEWLKKSASVAQDVKKKNAVAQAAYFEGLKRLEEDKISKIESESKNAISALSKWKELCVDQLLEDVKSFMNGDELTPTNIAFKPELIKNNHYHIEPSVEGGGVFLSVGYGHGFSRSYKPESLVGTVVGLMSGSDIKYEDIKFLKVERSIQQIRFTTPDSNWGSSFSHKLVHNIFSLELSTKGFCVSQNFRDSTLRSEVLGNIDTADQLRGVVDGFISRASSAPLQTHPRVYESNH